MSPLTATATTTGTTTTAGTTTRRRGGLLLACALACLPAEAGAHGEASPLIRSVVDRVQPDVPGVRFTPLSGPSSLMQVTNRTGRELEILDDRGEPFLRVGPRGVHGNGRSAAWLASGNPDGAGVPGARTGGEPRWQRVAREPVWAYYEHRLHPSQISLPREARGSRRPVRLLDFAIPFRHGGRTARLEGHLEFRPIVGQVAPELTSTATPLPGVRATLLPGRFPGVLLQNASRTPVTVLGRDGEPFARIGPGGVRVNLRSPLYVEDLRARGRLPEVAADARARPRWRTVSPTPSFTWLEPRARYGPEQPPDAVVRRERETRLLDWSVPLRAGTRRVALAGTTRWMPTGPSGRPAAGAQGDSATGSLLPWTAGAGVLALAALAALLLRRRSAGQRVAARR